MSIWKKKAEWLEDRLVDPGLGRLWIIAAWVLVALLLLDGALGWYWSREPDLFPVKPVAGAVPGQVTTQTLIRVASTLLDKPGGYLSNDMMPHRLWLDDMPNWEFGVLVQVRDMARDMRRDLSRSQSQSQEDADLAIAEPQFNFDNKSWAMPSTEHEYRRGIHALQRYLQRLEGKRQPSAVFYARADNLNAWLGDVQARLGALSQQLSNSVGREHVEGGAVVGVSKNYVKTPWSKVDDVFFKSRGECWALVELMRAVQIDFAGVLQKKNAEVSFEQVIRELEGTQQTVWSPIILNGSGFGILANHSLVMANYISRANAAIIDLRNLLAQG